jgi:Arc/MetJ-type ribon-helix-helix transcriptional regulator
MVNEPKRTERLVVMLSAAEVAAIEEFRFSRRMANRASAIRELLRRALERGEERETPTPPNEARADSPDVG